MKSTNKELIEFLRISSNAGIRSLEQLAVFLEIANEGEVSLIDLAGTDETTDPVAKKYDGVVSRLSKKGTTRIGGVPQPGLGLLDELPGRFKSPLSTKWLRGIRLSAKGKRLAKKLGIQYKSAGR
jgi:hypothetical protein